MPGYDGSSRSAFAATFPDRFAAAMAEARGAMAALEGAGPGGGGLIGAESLRRLHEVYRLKVELEIEVAGVLWRTSEVVCALADALSLLGTRPRGELGRPAPPAGIRPEEIESRRRAASLSPPAGRSVPRAA